MRFLHAAAIATAALFLSSLPSSAQSLGAAAAKEKEKRKGKPTGKVITEDDLRRAGGPGSNVSFTTGSDDAAAAGGEGTAPAAAGENASAEGQAGATPPRRAEKSEDQVRGEQQEAWRKKVEKANSDAQVLREQIAKIQTDLNDTSGGYYSSRRATLQNLLDQNKAKLTATEQDIANLEEEGRRNRYR